MVKARTNRSKNPAPKVTRKSAHFWSDSSKSERGRLTLKRKVKITPRQLAYLAGKLALDKKAHAIKILDLRKLSPVADFFVICSADANVHAQAVADNIVDKLKEKGERIWHKEGYPSAPWILLDYVDVVVHVFLDHSREFYNLERLWGDAPCVQIEENTPVKK